MYRKILFVATHEEMLEAALQVACAQQESLDTITGELFEAIEKIQKMDLSGKEIIVSRGGTAQLIRKTFGLPVVEVTVSSYDILRVLYRFREKRIAVVGAENVISSVQSLEKLMGLDICYYPFIFEEEIQNQIPSMRERGIDLVIGDTVAVRVAGECGFPSELIKSGKEAVADALDRAVKICEAVEAEREKNTRMDAVIEHLREGIIVLDEKDRVLFFNHIAEKMFDTTRQRALGDNFYSLVPDLDTKANIGDDATRRILHTNNGNIAISTIPFLVDGVKKGTVVTCDDVSHIQEMEQKIRQTLSARGLVAKRNFGDMIGESGPLKSTITLAKKYAGADSTVLIYGESGTGKELFAQSIHNYSERRAGPFVAINCATLPPSLLESTLFGYDEGAFTGAKKGGRKGMFEIAHNGTLFLDEIGEMDTNTQSKLLRVLQEHEIMRIGGDSIVPIDVRIIAASNRRLEELVSHERFRQDLYYRLNVLNICIPPLRERPEDIPLLIRFFTEIYCRKYNRRTPDLTPRLMDRLIRYNWPGNVRQLENLVQKLVLLSEDGALDLESTERILDECRPTTTSISNKTLTELTREVILKVLAEEHYNKTRTAQRLHITRATLNRHLCGDL